MTDTTSNKNVNLQNVGRFDPLKIKELQEQIADLQRQNELLQETVNWCYVRLVFLGDSSGIHTLAKMVGGSKAAIDGGALGDDNA